MHEYLLAASAGPWLAHGAHERVDAWRSMCIHFQLVCAIQIKMKPVQVARPESNELAESQRQKKEEEKSEHEM